MSDIDSATIRRSHFIERYKTKLANDYDDYLKLIDRQVRNILSRSSEIKSTKQLFSIQRRLREYIFQAHKDWGNHFKRELIDFSKSEINFVVKSLGIEVATPSASVLQAAIYSRPFQNTILREALTDLRASDIKLLKNAIAQGYYAGQSNAQIIRTIRGTKANNYKDGLLNLSKNRTARLVRTAVNHTSARAKEVFYSENSDIIKRYQWKSTLDNRTSDICIDLSDKIFKVGNGPLPPAHFNCRSTTIPVI